MKLKKLLPYIDKKTLEPHITILNEMLNDLEDLKEDFVKYKQRNVKREPWAKNQLDEVRDETDNAFWAVDSLITSIIDLIILADKNNPE